MRRGLVLCLGLLGAFASPAAAATRTVALETDNSITGPQPGELRYEINNADPGDTVEIAPGVNPKLSPAGVLGGGNLPIDKNLTVEGQGADATTISVPAFSSRIFKIGSVSPASVVTIRDLTMTGGRAGNGAPGAPGGGG